MNQQLLDAQERLFVDTAGKLLPPFPAPISQCNALNASPYLISLQRFTAHYGSSPKRRQMLHGLIAVIDEAHSAGACLQGLLVGGSFLTTAVEQPADIDCVYFYTAGDLAVCTAQLTALWARAKAASIDIRFVPFDANPLLALKACAFFTTLYSRTRSSAELSRGTVLVYRTPAGGAGEVDEAL